MVSQKKVSVIGKFRSSAGSWTEYTFPIWLTMADLKQTRWAVQKYLNAHKHELGFVPRTMADSWLDLHRDWFKRVGNDFDRLMLAYAVCLEPRAVKFTEFEWPD